MTAGGGSPVERFVAELLRVELECSRDRRLSAVHTRAGRIGVSRSTLYAYRSGEALPPPDVLTAYLNLLGASQQDQLRLTGLRDAAEVHRSVARRRGATAPPCPVRNAPDEVDGPLGVLFQTWPDPDRTPKALRTPSWYLVPHHRVIPFRNRLEFDELQDWCTADDVTGGVVRLVPCHWRQREDPPGPRIVRCRAGVIVAQRVRPLHQPQQQRRPGAPGTGGRRGGGAPTTAVGHRLRGDPDLRDAAPARSGGPRDRRERPGPAAGADAGTVVDLVGEQGSGLAFGNGSRRRALGTCGDNRKPGVRGGLRGIRRLRGALGNRSGGPAADVGPGVWPGRPAPLDPRPARRRARRRPGQPRSSAAAGTGTAPRPAPRCAEPRVQVLERALGRTCLGHRRRPRGFGARAARCRAAKFPGRD